MEYREDKIEKPNFVLNRIGYIIRSGIFPRIFVETEIKKKLVAESKDDGYSVPKSFKLYYEDKVGNLIIPRYFGLNINNPDKISFKYNPKCDFKKFSGELRENQTIPAECVMKAFKEKGGGILSLMTGGGKTMLSLYFIYMLKVKTIVIVPNIELINQWKQEAEKFIPGIRVGLIKGKIRDYKDKDLVIGMVNTISMQEFPQDFFNKFDLLIVDECHRVGSETFSQCLPKIRTPYTLGLSATPDRRDGLMHVVEYYLGPICYKSENKINSKLPVICELITYRMGGKYAKELKNYWNGKHNNAGMINAIAINPDRNQLIVNVINNILRDKSKERKILLLTDRKSQIKEIVKLLSDEVDYAEFTGDQSTVQLNKAKESRILLATYGIASTGFNLPELNTLILATPRKLIEQSIGRILRKQHDINPLIIDIIDYFSLFIPMGKARVRFYTENDFVINHTEIKSEKKQKVTDATKVISDINNI